MILTSLQIRLVEYGQYKGQYRGGAAFVGKHGSVEINLTPDMCEKIFAVCADGIIETATEAANILRVAVIEHARDLENKGREA